MTFDMSNPVIKRSGSSAVTYDLSQPDETTITLPAGSSWSSGLHWHETHDEYLRVLQGSIRVRLNLDIMVVSAGQEVKVPMRSRHEWSRADVSDGEEVIVVERTVPEDHDKHLFFWNLNGTILTAAGPGFLSSLILTMRLFTIFHELDNWPVLLDLSSCRGALGDTTASLLESVTTHWVLEFATFFATIFKFKAVDERFTPPGLLHSWKQNINSQSK